jgi:hypothetical protein
MGRWCRPRLRYEPMSRSQTLQTYIVVSPLGRRAPDLFLPLFLLPIITMRISPCFCLLSVLASLATAQADGNATYLIAPALVTRNNQTVVECWKLASPFNRSSTPGVNGAQVATLGNFTDLAYSILPPRYDGGLHNAPVPQLVHFLSGVAHITVPQDALIDLWLIGGKSGLLFAVDTTGPGHISRYPSDQDTVAITAPFAGGKLPKYEILSEGPCLGLQTFV